MYKSTTIFCVKYETNGIFIFQAIFENYKQLESVFQEVLRASQKIVAS